MLGKTWKQRANFVPLMLAFVVAVLGIVSMGATAEAQDTVSITPSPGAVVEGNNVVFTITRNVADNTQPLNVQFSTADGTAKAPGDYTAQVNQVAVIPANQNTVNVTVATIDDALNENSETFTVTITAPPTFTLQGTGVGTGTITDNDAVPTLTVAAVSQKEGNFGTTLFTFTATLSAASGRDVTFDVQTQDNIASQGTDYTAIPLTTKTIPAGQTTLNINVSVAGDNTNEPDETFFFEISNASNATIPGGNQTVNGTIQNDDPLFNISGGGVFVEGTQFLFTVTRTGDDNSIPRTINYTTVNGSAIAPGDYTAQVNQILTIPANQASVTIPVATIDDAIVENQETFSVKIFTPSAGNIATDEATGTIVDNDAPPTLSVAPVAAVEGDAGTKNFAYVLTLSAASANTITVDVHTSDDTATTADNDYTSVSQTVSFAPGVLSKTVNVPVKGDTFGEGDEKFNFTVDNGNAFVNVPNGSLTVTGTIQNDDVPDIITFFDVLDLDRTGTSGNDFADSTTIEIQGTKLWSSSGTGNAAGAPPTIKVGTTAVDLNDIISYNATKIRFRVPKGTPVGTHAISVTTDGGTDSDPGFIIPEVVPASITIGTATEKVVEGETYPTDPHLGHVVLTVKMFYATQAGVILPPESDVPITVTVTQGIGSTEGASATSFGPATITPTLQGENASLAGPGSREFDFPLDGGQVKSVSNSNVELLYAGNDGAQGNNHLDFSASTGTDGVDKNYAGKTTGVSGDRVERIDPHRIEVFDPVLDSNDPQNPSGRPKTLESDEKTGRTTTFQVSLYNELNTLDGSSAPLTYGADPDGAGPFKAGDAIPAGQFGSNIPLDSVPISPVFVTIRVNGSPDNPGGGDEAYLSTDTQQIPAREQVLVFSSTVDPTSPLYYTKPQTIYVHGLDDPDFDKDQEYQVEIVSVDSRDVEYVNLGKSPAQLTGIGQRTIMVNIDDEATDVQELPGVIILPLTSEDTNPNDNTFPAQPPLQTNESGSTATFTVRLSSKPAAPVQIFLRSSRPDEGTILTPAPVAGETTLTFTPANYDQNQVVTIVGVDDTKEDTNQSYRIITELESTDPDYGGPNNPTTTRADGIDPQDVYVTNIDNETAGVTVNPLLLAIVEGQSDTFQVVLNKKPVNDVFINLSSSLPGVASTTQGRLQFTPTPGEAVTTDGAGNTKSGWNVPQTVTVNTVSDPSSNADVQVSINLAKPISGDPAYNGITIPSEVKVFVLNDPTPGFTIVPKSGLSTSEAGNGNPQTFTVRLNTQPSADVTLPLTTSNPAEGRMINPQNNGLTNTRTLTFTSENWSTPQTVTVRGINDTNSDGNVAYKIITGDPQSTPASPYDNLTAADVADVDLTNIDDDQPNVLINPTDLVTNETGLTATFDVRLATQPAADVTVKLATSDQTEGKLLDNTNAEVNTLDLTFTSANWQTAQTVTVKGQDDAVIDGDVAYQITTESTSADNAYEGLDIPDVNVINNDNEKLVLSLSPTSTTVTEGDSGQTDISFDVNLSMATASTVTVQVDAVDGTAKSSNGDFSTFTKIVTFNPGETQKTVQLHVLGDTIDEQNETFTVALSNPTSGAVLHDTDAVATVTITDDDALPVAVLSDTSFGENVGNATFTVQLQDGNGDPITSGKQVSVKYATSDDSATAPDDYTASTGTVIIPAGQSQATFTVPIIPDAINEGDESFTIRLSNAVNATLVGGGATADSAAKIIDDEGPQLFIGSVSKLEGTGGTTPFVFNLGLSTASAQNVTVNYATVSGSAAAIDDFTPKTGSVTFAPGETEKTITIDVKADTENENTETFTVKLSNPVKATLGNDTGTGSILDDDDGPALSVNDISVTEGTGGTKNAIFTVSLSAPSLQAVTVKYATADVTATAGTDYAAKSGTLTFAANETTKTVSVPITTDSVDEDNETFVLSLSEPTNASIADSDGTATIVDDDDPPVLDLDTGAAGKGFAGPWVDGANPITGTTSIVDGDDLLKKATVKILDAADSFNESLVATDETIPSSYADGTLTITGNGTAAQYQAVLESIRYTNALAAPTYTTRHFQVSLDGGTGTAIVFSVLTRSGAVASTIDLNGTDDDEPGINFSRNWNKGGKTKLTDLDAVVQKSDNTNIYKIVITPYDDPEDAFQTDRSDGASEVLAASPGVGITPTFDDGTGALTLDGLASPAAYSTAIRSVYYTNSKATPTGTVRKFIFDVYANDSTTKTTYAISTITIKPNTDDWDGDGIPNATDDDKDGDGIPDTEDTDTDGDGQQDNVLLLDLNGANGSGVNFTTKWNQTSSTTLVDTDAFLSTLTGNDLIDSITVQIANIQDLDGAEVLSADTKSTTITLPGGTTATTYTITVTYDDANGVLTLSGTAPASLYESVLRTVRYTNTGTEVDTSKGDDDDDTTNNNNNNNGTTKTEMRVTGKNRIFNFTVQAHNGGTVSATTTINRGATLGIFTEEHSLNGNVLTITYTITNESAGTYNAISVNGTMTGALLNDQAVFTPSQGAVTGKWTTPRELDRIMHPEKAGKAITWVVGPIPSGQSANLKITVPLNTKVSGPVLGKWFASFGGQIPTQKIEAISLGG